MGGFFIADVFVVYLPGRTIFCYLISIEVLLFHRLG
tara:strand:+ start:480 stop:587 length:108 start_codon:yes stop_codon:yes gene_type:complete